MKRAYPQKKSSRIVLEKKEAESKDVWNHYADREERKSHPTGKWKVPKYGTLTLAEVEEFFSEFCADGNRPNVQESSDSFLVYMDCTYCIPPPSTCFINGILIREWHLYEGDYCDLIRESNPLFLKASTSTGESIRLVYDATGIHYPNFIPSLPKQNAYYSFSYRLKSANYHYVSITMKKENYHSYLRLLINCNTSSSMPWIVDTRGDDQGRVIMKLYYEKASQIENCIKNDYHPNVMNLSFLFSSE